MSNGDIKFKLFRNGDEVIFHNLETEEEIPARLAWVRPLTGFGKEVSVLDAKKKRELVMLPHPEHPDPATRKIIAEELQKRYFLPKITQVIKTETQLGNRYWEVNTDCGRRRFILKSASSNVTWVSQDRCIIKDVTGNCYEIVSLAGLDPHSRKEAEKVL